MGYKIMKFDGADFFERNGTEVVRKVITGYELDKDGHRVQVYSKSKKRMIDKHDYKKFKSEIPSSMMLDELESVIEKRTMKNVSYFTVGRQKATNQVVQVDFEYSVKQPHIKKQGDNKGQMTTKVVDGYNTLDIRTKLNNEGFDIDGIHYVRWIRSGGSARNGKCYFINAELENDMNEFSDCGVDRTIPQDLASNEAYRALPLSNKIDDIIIRPENILVIKDCESVFKDTVMMTSIVEKTDKKGKKYNTLETNEKVAEITNKIHDGQSLIDISLMPKKYQKKGMLLLRHIYFKSCCFNSNIQEWFKYNRITDVSQLNGITTATRIEDIKLITTPSSIKYYKFGEKENNKWFFDWLAMVEKTGRPYGIVKYEKPTKYFDGDLVRTHYQILNSIQLELEEVKKLAVHSIEYIDKLRTDYRAMLTYCAIHADDEDSDLKLNVNADIIYRLLSNNKDFADTEYYSKLAKNIIDQMRSDLKVGRILVKGNYSTLLGNPIEMLQASIGKWDGTSQVGIGNIVSTAFPPKKLLAARAPHICAGNVYLPNNTENELVKRFINLTDNIVVINSIGENTLQRLGGADMDSDVFLLTDNEILINGAERNYTEMKVPSTDIEPNKNLKPYTAKNLAELDYKTSKNLIGEIVNLSQILNSIYWDKVHNWIPTDEKDAKLKDKKLKEIYKDICQLSVMSSIEIDKAKKDYSFLDNKKELNLIRDKYKSKKFGKLIYPMFFKELSRKGKSKYKTKRYYKSYSTTVDYLENHIKGHHFPIKGCNNKKLSTMWEKDNTKTRDINWEKVEAIKAIVNERIQADINLQNHKGSEDEYRQKRYQAIKEFQDAMDEYKNIDRATLNELLREIEEDASIYLLQGLLDADCKNLMRILKTNPTEQYIRDENGEIEIYGIRYSIKAA